MRRRSGCSSAPTADARPNATPCATAPGACASEPRSCPQHGEAISALRTDELLDLIRAQRGKFDILAPVVRGRKGTYLDVFTQAARAGIKQALCDGAWVSTDHPPALARSREHEIDLVIGRECRAAQVTQDTVSLALRWGTGELKLRRGNDPVTLLSTERACPVCGLSVPELDPRWFSFATRQGRCETCEGQGVISVERGRGRARVTEQRPCPACGGARLSPWARAVTVLDESYPDFMRRSVTSALARVRAYRFVDRARTIAEPIVSELERRLAFMQEVRLDYLTLDRAAATLSGGEMQRLRLAAQLGAGLTGALYVLDEPTIGLHPSDTAQLLKNLRRLVDLGSTVLVVEHDADVIRAADYIIDLGPAGGTHGGQVVAEGKTAAVLSDPASPTAKALSMAPTPRVSAAPAARSAQLVLKGAREHNLKRVNLTIPQGQLTVVAGVSGSGKSTLVRQVLLPALRQQLGLQGDAPGAFDRLVGTEGIHRALFHRSIADRAHPAFGARHISRDLGCHPCALRRESRGKSGGLSRGTLLVQYGPRRTLCHVRRARRDHARDELFARSGHAV